MRIISKTSEMLPVIKLEILTLKSSLFNMKLNIVYSVFLVLLINVIQYLLLLRLL